MGNPSRLIDQFFNRLSKRLNRRVPKDRAFDASGLRWLAGRVRNFRSATLVLKRVLHESCVSIAWCEIARGPYWYDFCTLRLLTPCSFITAGNGISRWRLQLGNRVELA
jgi:hypothetical protein